MSKILLLLIPIMLWTASACLGQAQEEEKKLIPVKPSYHEASYVPHAGDQGPGQVFPAPPTPREQMYIFWLVGKMLSFPIDKVESFIRDRTTRPSKGAETAPAAAASAPNPFNALNWKEIPPAPPVKAAATAKP
jgi:hypothetical protein